MFDLIKFILGLASMLCVLLLIVVAFFICMLFGIQYAKYKMDYSTCNVFVAQKQVYSGSCHFISFQPVSQIDSTKHLIIFKDILKLHKDTQYINSDIIVEPINH